MRESFICGKGIAATSKISVDLSVSHWAELRHIWPRTLTLPLKLLRMAPPTLPLTLPLTQALTLPPLPLPLLPMQPPLDLLQLLRLTPPSMELLLLPLQLMPLPLLLLLLLLLILHSAAAPWTFAGSCVLGKLSSYDELDVKQKRAFVIFLFSFPLR